MYRNDYIKQLNESRKMATNSVSRKLKVLMMLGSVREGRLGDRVGKFMKKQMEERNYEVTVFDPAEMQLPLLNKPLHFYGPERKGAPEHLVKAEKVVKEADAILIITCEYNHSMPPALTNMMDHFPCSSYAYKPSGIVCYSPGIYGGMRSAMQVRSFTGELGCISVSNIFGIPRVQECLSEDGSPKDPHMVSGAKKMLDQLDWMALAMKNHREKVGIPQ